MGDDDPTLPLIWLAPSGRYTIVICADHGPLTGWADRDLAAWHAAGHAAHHHRGEASA